MTSHADHLWWGCLFEIPAYEHNDPITPKVMKCNFSFEWVDQEGKKSGCASVSPVEAIIFGKRKTFLSMAKQKMHENQGTYIDHIYGEKELGGASLMYIAGVDFGKLGFHVLPETPLPVIGGDSTLLVQFSLCPHNRLYAFMGTDVGHKKMKRGQPNKDIKGVVP